MNFIREGERERDRCAKIIFQKKKKKKRTPKFKNITFAPLPVPITSATIVTRRIFFSSSQSFYIAPVLRVVYFIFTLNKWLCSIIRRAAVAHYFYIQTPNSKSVEILRSIFLKKIYFLATTHTKQNNKWTIFSHHAQLTCRVRSRFSEWSILSLRATASHTNGARLKSGLVMERERHR